MAIRRTTAEPKNELYYGDNLDILPRYIRDESVDLVYLDPPFNSGQDYNVLFEERNGSRSAAQIKAFEDSWRWDQGSAAMFDSVIRAGGKVAEALRAFRLFLGETDMLAYLTMMAPRLVELHRVLKPTGSLYLHCDPTASHYLKILLDGVFGPKNFRNEMIWQRTAAHNDARRWGRVHDTLLFYSRSERFHWATQYQPYEEDYVSERYRYVDDVTGRLYWRNTMTAAGPGPARVFRGESLEPPRGTHWRFSQDKIDLMEAEGRIYYSASGKPYVKSFLDERKGRPVQDVWTDIRMTKSGFERLGYPTQKPEALLERIILASSNEGDTVLDPFCGCGTAVAVAQKLGRRWIGIDITNVALGLIKRRLRDSFLGQASFDVTGEPISVPDAAALAAEDPFQFQAWALGLVGARTAGPAKKGADRGIDGRLYFIRPEDKRAGQVVFSVKGGKVKSGDVRDLRGVIEREGAEIGVLVSLHPPTREMLREAASSGFYVTPWGQHPRIQILTVEQLLAGKGVQMPPLEQVNVTFPKAAKARMPARGRQGSLFG